SWGSLIHLSNSNATCTSSFFNKNLKVECLTSSLPLLKVMTLTFTCGLRMVHPVLGNSIQGEGECFHLDVVFKDSMWPHGGTHNMELLKMLKNYRFPLGLELGMRISEISVAGRQAYHVMTNESVRVELGKMGCLSVNWEGLSPKSRYILDSMKKLREKLDMVGKSLDVVQKDAQSTNTKVVIKEVLIPLRKRGERRERHRREEKSERRYRREEDRRDDLDLGKCKIARFIGDCMLEVYIDWVLKVEQLITSFGVQGRKGVSLVAVALEDCALVWWTSLMDHIRRGIKEPC
ncbi:hypothetical protein CR513_20145, partial [Mucuna pruriens]